jgi:hypothetical protein
MSFESKFYRVVICLKFFSNVPDLKKVEKRLDSYSLYSVGYLYDQRIYRKYGTYLPIL